ncbi:aldo/keto reductase [Streptosporangium sp. CA-115845]|uniref:aldo/keto reductase n=1 Tax=Streptosporangium sp. CA-115845 TaxID=3240071 RepID=UPI003D902230
MANLRPRWLSGTVAAHPLGVGCWGIGGPFSNLETPMGWSTANDARSLDGLVAAVECGATLFDTADVYGHGHSERLLGRLLRRYPREQIQLSSKVGYVRGTAAHPYAAPQLQHQLSQSLQNLGVEDLDLYFLHHLDFGQDDQFLPEAIDQMRALRQMGLVKAIGMRGPHPMSGDRSGDHPARLARFRWIFHLLRPDVLWVRFNPLTPELRIDDEDLFTWTARQGVGLLLAEPLAGGLLTGKYDPAHPPAFGIGDHRRGKRWFTPAGLAVVDDGLTPLRHRFGTGHHDLARVALWYCLQRAEHSAVLAGFTHPEQVSANYTALGDPLTPEELAFAEAAYAQLRAAFIEHGDRLLDQVTA